MAGERRNVPNHALRSRVLELLARPDLAALPERAFCRLAGCSRGLLHKLKVQARGADPAGEARRLAQRLRCAVRAVPGLDAAPDRDAALAGLVGELRACPAAPVPAPAAPPPMTAAEGWGRVEKLVRWHANRLARVGGRFGLAASAVADDIYQEAAMLWFARFKKFNGRPENLPKWATFTVQKAAADLRRQDRHYKAAVDHAAAEDEPFTLPDDDDAPTFGPATLARLRAEVGNLDPARRELLTRVYGLDGKPPADVKTIAAAKGVCGEAVYRQVRAAVKQMRGHAYAG